jgi:DNA-binding XRE family transcriptional regulator
MNIESVLMPTQTLPIPVKSGLRKLGSDIRDARLRRRIPSAVMAQRAFISRTTLVKVEKGDPGVGIGTYAAVLFALGMLDRLRDLASARTDEIGLALEEERLPKRIDLGPRRAKKAHSDSERTRA